MDIKPENILLSEDFRVKVTDFDQTVPIGDKNIASKGTRCYRAPEVRNGDCHNAGAADIFSLGVTLFYLKTRVLPFGEGKTSYLYEEFIKEDDNNFWKNFIDIKKDTNFFHKNFKNLIGGMLAQNPLVRPDISDIRKFEWINGPKLDQESLKAEILKLKMMKFIR